MISNPLIDISGNKIWRNERLQYHRLDGPAIEYVNGNYEWYSDGKRHREHGPSVKHTYGYEVWYQHGKVHRINGPAIINGTILRYFYDNVEYSKSNYLEKLKKEGYFCEICKTIFIENIK